MADDQNIQPLMEPRDQPVEKARSWFRFSLRSLCLATLVVAAFLAGRISTQDPFVPLLAGPWTATLPAGFRQPTTLRMLEGDRWLLSSRAGVFNGVYRYHDGDLTVEKPADARMKGLIWKWDGKQLTLVAEPVGTPTGSSYLGTLLVPAPSHAAKPGRS